MQGLSELLPLNSPRGFRRDVVDDPCDSADFVGYAVGDFF